MTDQAPAVPAVTGAADLDIANAPFTWKTLNAIAKTEFVPSAYRNNPEAILACVLTGRELGMGPMESLRRIDVIDGSASPSGEWMIARVFEAGHVVEVITQDDKSCTLKGIRFRDDKQLSSMKVTYTMAMAKRAGLADKRNWKQYPEIMLYWRAATMLCRQMFPDVLGGLKYVAEELGSEDWVEAPQGVKVVDGEFVPAEATVEVSEVSEVAEEVPDHNVIIDTAGNIVSDGVQVDAALVDAAMGGSPKEILEREADLDVELAPAPSSDPAWEELQLVLDHPNPTTGTREQIEQRVRKLFLLMQNLNLWPEDAWHLALEHDYGAHHWAELKKATMMEFTAKYFRVAAERWIEVGGPGDD